MPPRPARRRRPRLRAGLADAVKREGFSVATAGNLAQAREELARQEPDALLIDLQLPDGYGLDLLPTGDGRLPPGVIFITGHASVDRRWRRCARAPPTT